MNSASMLHKASFVLLVAILACLVYLIVRDRERHGTSTAGRSLQEAVGESAEAVGNYESTNVVKPTIAPLRPRATPPVVKQTTPVPVVASTSPPDEAMTELPRSSLAVPSAPAVSSGLASFAFAGDAANASIVGRVTLRGDPPAEKLVAVDPTCARLHQKPIYTRHYVVGKDAGLANVFVYVKAGAPPLRATRARPLLNQIGCEYQPYVMGVQTGEVFAVRNSDALLHNVHALPAINRERNFGQPTAGMITTMRFDKPEVLVRFKCDVHPWMFAFVGVVENQWFAVTDKDGNFMLPSGLPASRYTLAAVHPKAGELTQEITVPTSDNQPVNFTFEAPAPLASQ